jgi:hypothetical protein
MESLHQRSMSGARKGAHRVIAKLNGAPPGGGAKRLFEKKKASTHMPHPCDHPAAALAITRGLPNQLLKAKQSGDTEAAAAIEAALARARRIIAAPAPRPPRPPQEPEGWAEVVSDRRQRRWR